MSFQKRLFLTYSTLVIVLVIVVGIIFYQYSLHNMENNTISKINALSEKLIEDIDSLIHPMNFIIDYLILNSDVISSVITLSSLDRTKTENQVYINEAIQTLKSILYNYLVSKNYYRVNIFNKKGDFITSNYLDQTASEPEITKISWLKKADKYLGKNVIIPLHKDSWGLKDKANVFSIVRSLQGFENGLGYIEVQKKWEDVSDIFSQPIYENIKILAVTEFGEIFYNKNINSKEIEYYFNQYISNKNSKDFTVSQNPFTKRYEYVFVKSSKIARMKLIFVQDKTLLQKPLIITRNTIILFGFIIVLISLIYIYIFSIQFTSPIRKLKIQMDKIEINNLSKEINLENTNDEMKALNKAFQRLLDRLNEAINRELKYKMLQIKANFEALQAQINPHFIYNILNVLAHRGILNNDEETIEICNNLATMLRYSTSTTKHSATIEEELGHVNSYLLLMKKRFENKLRYTFNIDEQVKNNLLPKITLQPIVENSLNHGFTKKSGVMEVTIKGYIKDDWWYIEIIDNGDGFDNNTLEKLKKEMELIKDKFISGDSGTEFAIGGMGLLNTYARLLLFFNNDFIFDIDNNKNGAVVKIGAKISIGEGEKINDKNNVS